MNNPSQIPSSLKLETNIINYLGLLLLIVFTVFLSNIWRFQEVLHWLGQSILLWSLVMCRTSKILDQNRYSVHEAIYPNLGWANRLTLLRGFFIAVTGGFIFHPNLDEKILLIPALSYFIAAIIDRIDGYIARLTKHESLLGTELDIESDALGLLIAPLLAVWIGQIHWSYLSVSLAYYLFQWGLYWRSARNKPVYQLPSNMSRRAVAGFQMGFLSVVLWPILAPPATMIAGLAFMLPLLVGFVMDWFTVSGKIKLDDLHTRNFLNQLNKATHLVILPMLRILITLLLCLSLIRINSFPLMNNGLSLINIPLLLSLLSSALMISLGINGRFFAIILSCLLCWHFLSYEMQFLDGILLVSVIWVMQFGTGKFSLSIRDDNWVNRYDGA
ncbi:MAG: CDP-alcohol phosphatidyltransferase family protein [Gammaproteobacteria bacterium]|jgi:CDP-diacylglycerol---glycerol-3-phosphate 3-phosphatidyltransferase|nr:CDP-alcohol phosphatidyltransferase family protein [Gammaproteobacteria bacterium]